jgi:hypothetical protein
MSIENAPHGVPSTLVHLAVGAMVGTALLGERFTLRALAVVLVAAAIPDLDSFLFVFWGGAHRTALHTFALPAVVATGVYWDAQVRQASALRGRFGPDAPYVAGVGLVSLVAGGIFPDLFTNGVNALWPLHDEFVRINGRAIFSDQRGFVQTFVEFAPEEPAPTRTTQNTQYSTGVDPNPGRKPSQPKPKKPPERIFPLATQGWQLMLVVLSGFVVTVRSWQSLAGRRER